MELYEYVDSVDNKNDFVHFVGRLKKDLQENPNDWENVDLSHYLDAMERWVSSIDGYYANKGEKIPDNISWNVFANILMAAKMYE